MYLTLTWLDNFEILVIVFLNAQNRVLVQVGIFHQLKDLQKGWHSLSSYTPTDLFSVNPRPKLYNGALTTSPLSITSGHIQYFPI